MRRIVAGWRSVRDGVRRGGARDAFLRVLAGAVAFVMALACGVTPALAEETGGSSGASSSSDSSLDVWFYDSAGWASPFFYYYTDDAQPVSWPGVAMEDAGGGWYRYEVTGLDSVKGIFSDDGASQSPGQGEPGLSLTGGDAGSVWVVDGRVYDHQPEGVTVHYFDYGSWGNVNLYWYDSTGATGPAWPGARMFADGDGWWSRTVFGMGDGLKVLFSNGADAQVPARMEDGFPVSGEMWYRGGEWSDARPEGITVMFHKPDEWGDPRLYYYKNDSDTGPAWPGEAMNEVNDGWWIYRIEKYSQARIVFTDGSSQIPGRMEPGLEASGVMWYRDGAWVDGETDSDADGLADCMELVLGTDRSNRDSDGDGLPDGFEQGKAGTDPLNADSDGDGVADGDSDPDSDSLTNLREQGLGTDPLESDTDKDGVDDGSELGLGTDPLNADSDKDGLNDGAETVLGLDPHVGDSDGDGVPDASTNVSRTLDKVDINDLSGVGGIGSDLLDGKNLAVPSLTVTGAARDVAGVSVDGYDGWMLGDARGYVGRVIHVDGSFSSGTLTFTLSGDYTLNEYALPDGTTSNGLLVMHSMGGQAEALDAAWDGKARSLSVPVAEGGYYFVFDFIAWASSIGLEPIGNNAGGVDDSEDASVSAAAKVAPLRAPSLSDASIATWDVKGQADIVFAIDTTSSMYGAISNVKTNVEEFVDRIDGTDVSASLALVSFRDTTADGSDSTQVVRNNGSAWYTDLSLFKQAIDGLAVDGGGDDPETPLDALGEVLDMDSRSGAEKFVVLVTDAGAKTNNSHGLADMQDAADKLAAAGWHVSVVTTASYKAEYQAMWETTGGMWVDLNGDFQAQLLQIAKTIRDEVSDGQWIVLGDCPKYASGTFLPRVVRLAAPLANGVEADTDRDGASDIAELGGAITGATVDIRPWSEKLARNGLPSAVYSWPSLPVYVDYASDPTKTDTDGDLDYDACNGAATSVIDDCEVDPHLLDFTLNDNFIDKLGELADVVDGYVSSRGILTDGERYSRDIRYWYVFMYIRQFEPKYVGSFWSPHPVKFVQNIAWSAVGGAIDKAFIDEMKDNPDNTGLNDYFFHKTEIHATISKTPAEMLDIRHLAATMTALIYNTNPASVNSRWAYYHLLMPEYMYDDLAGWAGDVQTLMADAYVESKRNGTGFADEFYGMLGDEQHSLGMEDLFADVDAKNLYENLGGSEEVPQDIRDTFRIYYQNHYTGLKERVPQFTGYASKSSYLDYVKTYTHNIYSPMLVWPLMFVHNPSVRVFTRGQSDDAARIFTDFLMG